MDEYESLPIRHLLLRAYCRSFPSIRFKNQWLTCLNGG